MDDKLVVGIADMKMARQNGMLITYALGSCIGICLYDPLIQLASLVHIMLPLNMETLNLKKSICFCKLFLSDSMKTEFSNARRVWEMGTCHA